MTTLDEENLLLWEAVRPAMERVADQIAALSPEPPSHLDPNGVISFPPEPPVAGLPVTEQR